MHSSPPTSTSENSKADGIPRVRSPHRKKLCGGCKKLKGIGSFGLRNKARGWLSWCCKKCDNARARGDRLKPGRGDRIRAYYRRRCVDIGGKQYTRIGARYIMMRDFVITMYGAMCVCCGEARREFLCMDHVNNDGKKHRKEMRRRSIYDFLYHNRSTKFSWIRVLCHNCNMGRAFRGYCPHEREREAAKLAADIHLEKS